MQTGLQPLQQRSGIALLPARSILDVRHPVRAGTGRKASSHQSVVTCCDSDSRGHTPAAPQPRTTAGFLLATALTIGSFTVADTALAKSNPVKKSDPYEDLQNIIKSRGDSNSNSLIDNFKKSAQEAAKLPAEILSSPAQPSPPSSPSPPVPAIPLPITKALPEPNSKAEAAVQKSGAGSTGLLAGVAALVVAAGFALNASGGSKKSGAPKPNQIKAKVKGGTQEVGKQASKPSLALPSLRGKAQQAGKSLKGGAKQASKQAPKPTFSLPSLSGKASQVGKTAKIKAGSAPQKAKKAVSSATGTGFFGTGSTRGKSAPAKQGSNLGTRSTRPVSTQKVKASPGKSAAAVKKPVNTGGRSLGDEDTSTTIGAVGVVGLALAVGALTISSITSSIGGGGGAPAPKAPEPVKKLLDRVPEPLPVSRKAEQAATQVASKAQEAVPQSAPSLKLPSPPPVSPPSIPNPKDIQPPPLPTPRDTLPPVAQTPQTPSGPDLVPELMQKPKTGAPLAQPPSDATKPKVPSGPDLRVPGPQSLSLGAAPQLASGPAKAASKAAGKVSEAVPQVASAPSPSKAADKLAESSPAPSGGGSPVVLLGLAGLVVGGVLLAKQTQPNSDSKGSGGGDQGGAGGNAPSPTKGAAASNGGQAPQSAEEAAADAKQRSTEAREWIDNWKSKQ